MIALFGEKCLSHGKRARGGASQGTIALTNGQRVSSRGCSGHPSIPERAYRPILFLFDARSNQDRPAGRSIVRYVGAEMPHSLCESLCGDGQREKQRSVEGAQDRDISEASRTGDRRS